MRVFQTSIVFLVAFSLPAPAESNPDLCEGHDWFQMRDKVAGGGASLLCKGAVDASFEHLSAAERELKAVIRKMPHSASSYDARGYLTYLFFRNGQYRKALKQIDLMIAEKPSDEDTKAIRSLFAVLASHPDQSVTSGKPSTIRSEIFEGNLFVPVTANGVAGTYIVDTGANISIICESEARRLGLKVDETSSKMSDITGTAAAIRVAEAQDLWIGKTHLKHVAFAVYPDANEPFIDLPEGRKAILGISVLIALGTFRVEKENRFDIQAGTVPPSAKVIPLAFDGAMPVTQLGLYGRTLNFTFDTGAGHTALGPVFASAFPDLMRTGSKKDYKLKGFSGSTNQESVVLPSVKFLLGKEVELAPAIVLLKTTTGYSEWATGNLGFDLISQTIPFTIDFRAMQLIVEDR
jgi:predicted aspartyl protease